MFMGLILAFPNHSLQAAQADPYKDGPVHEAFLTSSTEGGVVLQSIAKAPPSPINEQQPPKCHSEAIWISGYWSWVHDMDDFVWVSGVWRRPPPGHVWISGYWKKFDAGWAWVRGFWSSVSEHDIKYINTPPPNPKEQQIPATPGENYFWMPGYWNYDYDTSKYNWLNGQWTELDASWIYIPAYYLWRPDGYIFVPGYWDLPIETRGCAYTSVIIPPAVRSTIIYTPAIALHPEVIIRWAFLYFPDHSIFFWHHRHFHPGFWGGFCCTPPWWNWNSCWCFNWGDTWGLWWWWTHPGFQQPWWLLFSMANHIPPPPWLLLNMIRNIMPPPIITPFGAVPPLALIDAIRGNFPIMPNDPKDLQDIFDKLKSLFPDDQTPLRPSGNESDLDKPLPRPDLGDKPEPDDTMVTPPPKPPSALPPITKPPQSYIPKPPSVVIPPILPPRPPQYSPPIPKPPTYHPPSYHPPRPQARPYPRPHSRPHHEPRPHPRPHHNPWMTPRPDGPGQRIPWPQPGGRPSHPPQSYPPHSDTDDDDMDVPMTPRPGGSNFRPPSQSHYPRIRQGQQIRRNQQIQRIQRNPQIQRGNWNQPRFNPNTSRHSQPGPMQTRPPGQTGPHGEFQ
jgi:WXXGXW repeat (2 copies)